VGQCGPRLVPVGRRIALFVWLGLRDVCHGKAWNVRAEQAGIPRLLRWSAVQGKFRPVMASLGSLRHVLVSYGNVCYGNAWTFALANARYVRLRCVRFSLGSVRRGGAWLFVLSLRVKAPEERTVCLGSVSLGSSG
jgi:hypothetical protein